MLTFDCLVSPRLIATRHEPRSFTAKTAKIAKSRHFSSFQRSPRAEIFWSASTSHFGSGLSRRAIPLRASRPLRLNCNVWDEACERKNLDSKTGAQRELDRENGVNEAGRARFDGQSGVLSRRVSLATIGLRQNSASTAAARLHPNATQNTGSHDPVISSNLAAPHPEKIDATPFEV